MVRGLAKGKAKINPFSLGMRIDGEAKRRASGDVGGRTLYNSTNRGGISRLLSDQHKIWAPPRSFFLGVVERAYDGGM